MKYTAADFNSIMRVNVTRCLVPLRKTTEMAKHRNGGLIVLIASVSPTIAGEMSSELFLPRFFNIVHC